MQRNTLCGLLVACVVTAVSCSGTPQTPVSPDSAAPGTTALNPDGSTVKATAPAGLDPASGAVVSSVRPTLQFANSTGRFQNMTFTYDIEVQTGSGAVVYERTGIGQGGTTTSHTIEIDLNNDADYWWRARPRVGSQVGPWSPFAQFRTPARPGPPPPPPGGGLPFPVPAECGPGDPGNRFPCVLAVASQSAEWALCARGVGIGCHRFTRQVAFALSRTDPNWAMIRASPGGHACNCFDCGPSDGTMFREDTVVYGGNRVFDMIVGAGGSNPSLSWGQVVGPRPGDIPTLAPLCTP